MQTEFFNMAKRATEEGWDAYKIMAEFTNLQKEKDAVIAETTGSTEIAALIRAQ